MAVVAPATGTSFASRTVGSDQVPDNFLVDSAGADVLGMVTASPNATSVLGRLKASNDTLTLLSAKFSALGTQSIANSLSITPATSAVFTVSGSVTVSGTAAISAASLPLPTGAATETTLAAASAKLPASLGAKTAAASFSVVAPSDAPLASSYPQATTGVFIAVSTNATGTTYNAFGTQACKTLSVYNATGTALEFRRGGSGDTFIIPDGGSYTFTGLSNASGMQVRRADVSNDQVSVKGDALT